MTAWWGLVGLAGLPGIFGLIRASARRDPLARYPTAREPAVPNADAAHTPLMTPRVTPEMLHRDGGLPGGEAESGRVAPEVSRRDGGLPGGVAKSAGGMPEMLRRDGGAAEPARGAPEVPRRGGGLSGGVAESARGAPEVLRRDVGPPGGEAESAGGKVPRARAGDHDRPVPTAGVRPEAPPSAGRLRRTGALKSSPGGRSAVREPLSRRQVARPSPSAAQERDAEGLVPTQPFAAPSRPDGEPGKSGTLAGELPQAAPERAEEPSPAAEQRSPGRRLSETARQLAASAVRTVRERRGQFIRIIRKGNSR